MRDRALLKTVSVNLLFGIGFMSWETYPTEAQADYLPCVKKYTYKLVILAGAEAQNGKV